MVDAKGANSRLSEVRDLLELMKERGVSSLRVGDIELTLAHSAPVPAPVREDDVPRPKLLSSEEREAEANLLRRKITLASGSRIVSRAGE